MSKEYIERDSLIAWVANNVKILNYARYIISVLSDKERFPAADVKPIVRGRWYDEDCFDAHGSPIYRCSICNKTVADNYISAHKYCLHCGAEMLEGDLK